MAAPVRIGKIFAFMAVVLCIFAHSSGAARPARSEVASAVVSLDGSGWLLATDPANVGREQRWWSKPVPEAKPTNVPWIIQDVFPDYHGVAWYWREFKAPVNPHQQGRYLIRFWAVDYKADVWVNGKYIGGHEGGETPFVLDATGAVKANSTNLVAVRVLNPKDEPIDGITLKQTPHRNKTCAFTCGCDYNHGGIEDSVELLVLPAVYVEDMFVQPDPKTGEIRVRLALRNTLLRSAMGRLQFTVAPADGGATAGTAFVSQKMRPGDSRIETRLRVEKPRLWQLNDPYLYRVTVRVCADGMNSVDEQSTRCGFRDFRLKDGYFRLNGKRIFLRSSVSGNTTPIGIHVAYDPDWLRRDIINSKAMGFNTIRFYGLPTRSQLDLCDEIGLMVQEECFACQLYENSPKMAERFDQSTGEMILRDRNHPSIVMWGLLNETADSEQYRHAVTTLPLVRSLDPNRVVMLSSGRFDYHLDTGSISNPGSKTWECLLGAEKPGAARTKHTDVPAYVEGTGDAHVYPWVPHTAKEIKFLRTLGQNTKHVFVSENGVSSALDLIRLVRQYEQRGKESCGEAMFYRQALDKFMVDWNRWRMAECFGRPEDYFRQCQALMAGERLDGINALRSNPNIAGYTLTGTADQGYSGEGIVTNFREFKPGTVDAISDGFAPLRWCLFAEPVNVYRGRSVKLDAVLADEDVLSPGEYPVRLEVFGPNSERVLERKVNIKIPDPNSKPEPPLALPVFSEDVTANWPAGDYRFVATFEKGGAAAGREATIRVVDPAQMPKLDREVVLWGEDSELEKWLNEHGIKFRLYASAPPSANEVILVGNAAPSPGGVEVFKELAARIAKGSTAVFIEPNVFAYAGQPISLSCIGKSGTLINLPNNVYHKEDWAKNHPIFNGLPAGAVMDYSVYREVIGNLGWVMNDAPYEAVAGAIYAFTRYSSGLLVAVDKLGEGRIILNALRIRENIGRDPAADQLLLNMLRYAAHDGGNRKDGGQNT